ncbi:MAG: Uma2 family endonuclease [Planctomycetes bacterium]|nr:Uma2 family endonuclease [Planctomycetota bacterium]
MIAIKERPAERIVLPRISWEAYETLAREIGERHIRLTYDEGDLEIMTLSFGHENAGEWLGRLIFFLALELRLSLCSGGSTTLKKALCRKGLEPDKSFWIQHESRMRGKTVWDLLIDPPPDLVAEVDITSSSIDRLAIYAALKVPEIWHYNGKDFRVLVLAANGKYKKKAKSPTFPWLPIKEFATFLHRLGTVDEVALIQEYIDWLRARVVPRKQPSESRQNGKNP